MAVKPCAKRKASSVKLGEPILVWFPVAMRMTQLSQALKGLPADPSDEQDPAKHVEECLRILRRAKAYLWRGSPHRALQTHLRI